MKCKCDLKTPVLLHLKSDRILKAEKSVVKAAEYWSNHIDHERLNLERLEIAVNNLREARK